MQRRAPILLRCLCVLALATARAATPAPPDPLQVLYASGATLWFDGTRLSAAGRDLLHEMRDAERRGLDPADYDAVTLEATATISQVETVTLDEDPAPVLDELADVGIDMNQVTEDLLDAGIDAFVHSLDGLIEGIEKQGGSPE